MTEVGGDTPPSRRSPTKPVLPEKKLFIRYRHVYAGKGGWFSTRTSMTPPVNYNSSNQYLDVYKKELILKLSKDIFESSHRQSLGGDVTRPGTYPNHHKNKPPAVGDLTRPGTDSHKPPVSDVTQPDTDSNHHNNKPQPVGNVTEPPGSTTKSRPPLSSSDPPKELVGAFETAPITTSESGARGFSGGVSQEDPVDNTAHEKVDNCFITSLKRAHTIIGTIHPADNFVNNAGQHSNQSGGAGVEQTKQVVLCADSSIPYPPLTVEINASHTAGSVSSVNGDVLTQHTHQTGDPPLHKYQSTPTTTVGKPSGLHGDTTTRDLLPLEQQQSTIEGLLLHSGNKRPHTSSGVDEDQHQTFSHTSEGLVVDGDDKQNQADLSCGDTGTHVVPTTDLQLRVLRERSFVVNKKTSRMAGGDGRLSRSGRHLVTRMSQEALLAISETRREMAQVEDDNPSPPSPPLRGLTKVKDNNNTPAKTFKLRDQKTEHRPSQEQELLLSPASKKQSTEATPISPDLKLMSVMSKQRKKDTIRYSVNMSRMNGKPSSTTSRCFSKSGSGLRIHPTNGSVALNSFRSKLPYLNSCSTEELHKVNNVPGYRENNAPGYRAKNKDSSAPVPLTFHTLNNFRKLPKEKSFQITPPGWDVRYKDTRKGQEALDDTPEEVKVKAIEKCSDWLTRYM